ncbi:vitamin K epoxide reductase family protein [Flavobacterium sp.]|uniref:vitamin K epoxide reductase family protein n=1 Tax=Flavobacterium sp. TaxID=239 RepID=UPI00261CF230|nr:vitamin K epoxide reductase family protein [Flavobacterium sp.]
MTTIVKKYLTINNYLNQQQEFEELFLSHPNYPSVYAITDSLNMLSIENVAAKVPKENLHDLPHSFLAIFNQLLVLAVKTSNHIELLLEKGQKQIVSFHEFIRNWDGIIIVVEPNKRVSKNHFKIHSNWVKYSIPILTLIALSFVYHQYNWNSIIMLISSAIGLIFSIFIIQENLGFKNSIITKLCNINENTSCNSVIQSESGKINKWFGFSDLTLLFFGINLSSILLQPKFSTSIIGFLSLLSLPIIVYSIWLQKYQLKKWCLLCLMVSLIIILQCITWFFVDSLFSYNVFSNLFAYLFSFIAITSLWFVMKPILELKIKSENALIEFKKFKKNYNIFNFLSKEITVKKEWNELGGIHFGNNNVTAILTIILSPSCKHCYKVFDDSYHLVSKFPKKIALNVLFNINPENNDNPYKTVVENLLAINNSNPNKVMEALSDWYIQKMKIEQWLAKWESRIIDMKVNYQIRQQYNWCLENDFNYTPVKMINSKLFPDEYEINELKYFLDDIEEEKEIIENKALQQL